MRRKRRRRRRREEDQDDNYSHPPLSTISATTAATTTKPFPLPPLTPLLPPLLFSIPTTSTKSIYKRFISTLWLDSLMSIFRYSVIWTIYKANNLFLGLIDSKFIFIGITHSHISPSLFYLLLRSWPGVKWYILGKMLVMFKLRDHACFTSKFGVLKNCSLSRTKSK